MCCNKQNMFLFTSKASIKDMLKRENGQGIGELSKVKDVGQCDKKRRQMFPR